MTASVSSSTPAVNFPRKWAIAALGVLAQKRSQIDPVVLEDLLEGGGPSKSKRGESRRPYSVRSTASAITSRSGTSSDIRTTAARCEMSMW